MSLAALTGIAIVALASTTLLAIRAALRARRSTQNRSDQAELLKEALDRARSRQLEFEPERLGPPRLTSSQSPDVEGVPAGARRGGRVETAPPLQQGRPHGR